MEENMEVLIRLPDQSNRNDYLVEDSNGFVDCSTVKDDEQSNSDDNLLEASYSVLQDTSHIENCFPDSLKSSIQLLDDPVRLINNVEEAELSGLLIGVVKKGISSAKLVDCDNQPTVTTMGVPDTSIISFETQEPIDFCAAGSKKVFSSGETYDLEEETDTDAAVMTQSGQICSTELLGDIIENARIEKITLSLAKDSLVQLMNEVELKEKTLEQARQEAAQGGLCTFARAEDMRQMTQRAKEANDMHAGEVYGEKAILATEVRELQSRLLSLSDERDKALAILDEMHQALEAQLAVTEKDNEEAHRAKQEKEESAQKYLAYEDSIMEKVVQESKLLKQVAEENSKLREFLMDRGRVVDMLQGEISVICQDVKLMKDKFQRGVPLNKSLSSSQITRILASSSSSSASAASKVLELADSPENPMASARTFADDQFYYEEGPTVRKEFMDAGWEFLDDV